MTHTFPTVALRHAQMGRFLQGILIVFLIGLSAALGVALYFNKMPTPFVNKVPLRTSTEDNAEAEKNRQWNPNDLLIQGHPRKPPERTGEPALSSLPPGLILPPPEQALEPESPSMEASATPPPPAPGLPQTGTFFVQAGAFSRLEDAEQQRARLAIINLEAKVSEKAQSGRTIYRVRLGPFEKKADADAAKTQLESEGIDASLFKTQ